MHWYKIVLAANPSDRKTKKFNLLFSRLFRDGSRFLRSGMVFTASGDPDENSITHYFSPEAYEGLLKFVQAFDPLPCEKPNIVTLNRYRPT